MNRDPISCRNLGREGRKAGANESAEKWSIRLAPIIFFNGPLAG
jgi:hypothetical protein